MERIVEFERGRREKSTRSIEGGRGRRKGIVR
jgi:hypothetical protein